MRRIWLFPLFIMLTVYVYFYMIGEFGFIDPYETIYAVHSGAGTLLNNFFDYIRAGAFFIFGENEFAGRIIQVIFGVGGAFLVYLSTKYLTASRKASHIAAFITLTSPLYFTVSHLSVPDIIFAFTFTLAMTGYVCASQGNNKKSGIIIFYIGLALASLSGGFVRGTIIPLITALIHIFILKKCWSCRLRDYRLPIFSDLFSLKGIIIYILIISPLILKLKSNNFINALFSNILFADTLFINTLITNLPYNAFLMYIIIIFISMFPWCILSYWAFKSLYGNFTIAREDAVFVGIWTLAAFIAGFPNIAVCIPPASILISSAVIDEVIEYPVRSFFRPFIFYSLCLIAVASLIFNIHALRAEALLESRRDIAKIALDYLKYQTGSRIVYYGEAMPGLSFYLKRDAANFSSKNHDNNATGIWSEKQRLRRLWNGAKQMLLITRKSDADSFKSIIGREPVKIGESTGDILFTNY